jgi:hypothetical protein
MEGLPESMVLPGVQGRIPNKIDDYIDYYIDDGIDKLED